MLFVFEKNNVVQLVLCVIEELIKAHNEKEKQVPLRLPDLKIIITATEYGYRRDDGVLVIPIGCLKD